MINLNYNKKMNNFDIIEDEEGKEYLIFDKSELYDDSQMGDKLEDFTIIKGLGKGTFGNVYKVRSKKNNKIYAMKEINFNKIGKDNQIKSTKRENLLKDLSHPHIIKYYKGFEKEQLFYNIYEFIANGDLFNFMKFHKKMNKQIQEEEIWNLFLQSMEALYYVHSMGLIHRDIKPANLFIDNNMSVKLGDFGVCALMNNNENSKNSITNNNTFKNIDEDLKCHETIIGSEAYIPIEVKLKKYDQRFDVYSMGASFFELCYFHIPKKITVKIINEEIVFEYQKIEYEEDKNVHYSKELLDIINLMLEEDKNKRKTSKEILDIIREEYSNKYIKNTSINSITRCLYALTPLRMYYLFKQIENKPITEGFIQCIKYISLYGLKSEIIPIKDLRQILASANSNLEGTKEVDPRYILAFLINEINKETNELKELKDCENKFLINEDLDKEEMMIKFINNISNKTNSFICKCFKGLMKKTMNCSKCRLRTFKFINFFFITFTIEKNLKNIKEQLYLQTDKKNETLYCKNCLNFFLTKY